MTDRARRSFWTLAAALLLQGCQASLPAQPHPERASTCAVSPGDLREDVLSRCGLACGTGSLPEGKCADSAFFSFSVCANACDVYRSAAVCYHEAKVVRIVQLRGRGMAHLPTCEW